MHRLLILTMLCCVFGCGQVMPQPDAPQWELERAMAYSAVTLAFVEPAAVAETTAPVPEVQKVSVAVKRCCGCSDCTGTEDCPCDCPDCTCRKPKPVKVSQTTKQVTAQDSSLLWHQSLSSTKLEVLRTGKPAIVFFTGKFCAPCQKVKQQFQEPLLQQFLHSYVLAEIDIETLPQDWLERNNITSIPVILAIDGEWLRCVRVPIGSVSAASLLANLEASLDRVCRTPQPKAQVASKTTSKSQEEPYQPVYYSYPRTYYGYSSPSYGGYYGGCGAGGCSSGRCGW